MQFSCQQSARSRLPTTRRSACLTLDAVAPGTAAGRTACPREVPYKETISGAGDDRIVVSSGNDVVRCTGTLGGHDVVVGFDANASDGQDVLNLDALFDSLGSGTAARAARVSLTSGVDLVDVPVDVGALADGGNVITVETLQIAGAISVGQDVLVGAA